jgi:hypothetical protein
MLRKSLMIAALSALPAAGFAQGTPEEAYDAAVKAGACQDQGGIRSAAYRADGAVRVVCNRGGTGRAGPGALGAVVILAALGGGSSTTTSTAVVD